MVTSLSLNRICFFVGCGAPSDHLVSGVLEPILPSFGYELRRASHIDNPHVSRAKILRYLLDADLVVFDLSEPNADVAFDVGIRYLSGRPLLAMNRFGSAPPCALTHLEPISYFPDNVQRTALETCRQLTRALHEMQTDPHAGRPIFEYLGDPVVVGGVDLTLANIRVVEEALRNRGAKTGVSVKRTRGLSRLSMRTFASVP